ncbi:YeeE/YedE thiosulfate transporter family protein [Thermodesulfobacteriota bacterium]
MSGTLYAANMLQSGTGFMISGLIGIMFGFFLEQAGFGSSRKLTAIFYFKDMAVLKVMFTAVLVTMVGYQYLVALGWLAQNQIYLLETYWLAQTVGGLIFGVGFVVGGWCPGTAVVGLASAKLDALVFLIGVLLGSILFNELFALIRPIYEGMRGSALFLYDLLNISPELLIFLFCLFAVVLFIGSTRIERWTGKLPKVSPGRLKSHARAAVVLILFAAGLFITPQRTYETATLKTVRSHFLNEVAQAEDHIEPMELAEKMMKNSPHIIVVDIRSPEEYNLFHLRGAINIPLEMLAEKAHEKLPKDIDVVLYSNGTTHAAQAWTELRHWGWSNIRVLTDGILAFWRECLTPPSLAGLTDEQMSKELLASFNARKAAFLGKE